ncbi:MAG TPA: NAD(P)-dependent oxidoreductase [Myxococcota bacterium]|nr:NAD(P)-dependent oxidoreductase [Myxococcota bacterium]
MLRVLIADSLPDSARTHLQQAGMEVVFEPSLKDDKLLAALELHDPEVLVVRSTKVRAEHFGAARALQLVVRAGAGFNTIDLAAASGLGVYVSNCPGMNAVAVAELAFAHILNADRRIADAVADLRGGSWKKKTYARARGLKGRTLGVIGFGGIGSEVARRGLAFEMEVLAWSPFPEDRERAEAIGVRHTPEVLEVAAQADVLTVHLALNPATRGFIGPAIFDELAPGTIFVNTSRGEVVDEPALAKAVRDKHIKAGLDVYCGEPSSDGQWTSTLTGLAGVYGTPHVGASTEQAQEAVANEAVRVILDWQTTGSAPNCVNLATRTAASHLLVVRHEDRVGVLAQVLDLLRENDINVQQMENVIFSGGGAACARIQLDRTPPARALATLREAEPIFDAKIVELA